eukprot:TRINITY_DN6166_c0_g1_i1.p1 TRINITY_DN6166_c0_g1~~TRINITY_DN6166_c0_g1_i1.p1  ORF type:complete len:762 (-),score=216.02 TRINITY_DN6166_c0_g1_i1:52-2184(-)
MVKFYFTEDGKEFVTPAQLLHEINQEILRNSGRICYLDIAPLLRLQSNIVEAKVQELVKKNPSLTIVNLDVVSGLYLDKIAREIDQTLAGIGELRLSSLSHRFDLPLNFLSDAIAKRMGRLIHGHFDGEMLFTEAFIARQRAAVRGALSGATRPTPLAPLAQAHHLSEPLYGQLIDELIASGRLSGRVDNGQYWPDIFLQFRDAWATSFFSQNDYIEYTMLERLHVSNPRGFSEALFSGDKGLALTTCCISASLRDRVDTAIVEALAEKSCVDISSLLPPSLSAKDITSLLRSCPSLRKGQDTAVVLGGRFVASVELLMGFVASFEAGLKERAAKGLITLPSPQGTRPAKQQQKSKAKNGKKKGKSGKRRGKGRGADSEDSDEAAGDGDSSSAPSGSLTAEEVEAALTKFLPPDVDADVVPAAAEHVLPQLEEAYARVCVSLQQSRSDQTRERRERLQAHAAALYLDISLTATAADQLQEEKPIIEKYLQRTLCADAANALLLDVALRNAPELPEGAAIVEACGEVTSSDVVARCDVTPAARMAILGGIPAEDAKLLKALWEASSKKSCADFAEELYNVCEALQVRVRCDKKSERERLEHHRRALAAAATAEASAPALLHLTSMLLNLRLKGLLLLSPPRCVGGLLKNVEDDLPAESAATLRKLHGEVTAQLKACRTPSPSSVSDTRPQQAPTPTVKQELLDATLQIALQ